MWECVCSFEKIHFSKFLKFHKRKKHDFMLYPTVRNYGWKMFTILITYTQAKVDWIDAGDICLDEWMNEWMKDGLADWLLLTKHYLLNVLLWLLFSFLSLSLFLLGRLVQVVFLLLGGQNCFKLILPAVVLGICVYVVKWKQNAIK